MRQYLARQCQPCTRTGEEWWSEHTDAAVLGKTNVSCIQEQGRREESEHTDTAALGKAMSVVYKKRGGVRTHRCGSNWQDNFCCIQEQGRREESEHSDAAVLGKKMSI